MRDLRGLGALRARGARRRACGARSSRRAPTAARCSRRPASPTSSRRGSTASSPRASTCAASPRPTRSWPAARALGVGAGEAAVFEDALAGVAAGRAGDFGFVVGVDRVGQADALREHGADIVVADLAELLVPRVIAHPDFRRRAVVAARDRARPRRRSPRRSRCSRSRTATSACAATSTRASRSACPARTSTRSTSCGRCRTPRPATATRSRARRSSTSRTARSSACSSTTSRSTCATASCSRTSACSTCARACSRRRVEWRSPAGTAVRVRSTRLVSFVQRAVAAILYEVEPLDGPVRVVVQSELVANEPAPPRSDDPRAAAVLESPLVSEEFFDHDLRAVLSHSTRGSKLGDGRRDGPPRRGARRARRRRREPGRSRARDDRRRPRAGRAPPGRQVHRLRVVEPALASGAARRDRRGPGRGAAHGLAPGVRWPDPPAPVRPARAGRARGRGQRPGSCPARRR